MSPNCRGYFYFRQSGAALVIGLIILLLMTLIGVTAMQSTTLQGRMAGNMQQRNVAFQRAEAAVLEAECRLLTNGAITSNANLNCPQRPPNGNTLPHPDDVGDATAGFNGARFHPNNNQITEVPTDAVNGRWQDGVEYYEDSGGTPEGHYFIRRDPFGTGDNTVYQITARGIAGSAEQPSYVILQTIYRSDR